VALRHFEGALSLARETSDAEGTPLPETFLAHDRLGSLADRLGALEDAADHYQDALDLQQVAPDEAAALSVRARLAGVRRRQGDLVAAERELAMAFTAIATTAERAPATAATIYRELGRIRLAGAASGRPEGLSALAQACTLFERAGLPAAVAACRLERGKALLASDLPRQAIAECSRAHGLFTREEVKGRAHGSEVIAALHALADCYDQLGDAPSAATFRQRASARAARDAAAMAADGRAPAQR
jgi:tetratricopeptide (TPR) repeat protein